MLSSNRLVKNPSIVLIRLRGWPRYVPYLLGPNSGASKYPKNATARYSRFNKSEQFLSDETEKYTYNTKKRTNLSMFLYINCL